jgi:site-specific DNA-methyltransferase (adenine-specific)
MPADRGVPVLPGVIREPVRKDEKLHLTGKPVEAMRKTVRICAPGGLVLDPFSGSASTGVACEREGLRFLGVEISEVYAAIGRKRLAMPRAA